MNKLDKQYTDLLQDILDNGVTKQDRTGTGTISVFGRQIRHNMKDGFPLLTTKKMPFKTIVTELLWFLRGNTNIKYLVDNGCNIWNGDAYKNYYSEIASNKNRNFDVPLSQKELINKIKTDDGFAKKWGELGPIYGKQWRKWTVPRMEPKGFDFDTAWEKSQELWKSSNGMECGPSFETFCMSLLRSKKMGIAYGYHTQIDQIQNLINDLKTNPDSRRLMVNAWNVGELDQMVLPPCHYGFQVYTRELSEKERINLLHTKHGNKGHHIEAGFNMLDEYDIPTRAISLMWNQRSVDTFLGLPFNIASYGLLLEIIAKEVNMVPDQLIGNLGDVHLYSNHLDAAKEQIGREMSFDERIEYANDIPLRDTLGRPVILAGFPEESYQLDVVFNVPKRTREPFPLPTLNINTEFWKTLSGECGVGPLDTNLQGFEISDFEIVNYQSHPTIKAPLSN
jgi:thymidylate synthase